MTNEVPRFHEFANILGRRRLLKSMFVLVTASGATSILSACGAGSSSSAGKSSTGPGAKPKSASIIAGATATAAQGSWQAYAWTSGEGESSLPQEAMRYGITDKFGLPRWLNSLGTWPYQVEVTDGSFAVTGNVEEFYIGGQTGSTHSLKGTWTAPRGRIVVSIPLIPSESEYYNNKVVATAVPESVTGSDTGKFRWEFNKGNPDFITYEISGSLLYLACPNEETGGGPLHQFLIARK